MFSTDPSPALSLSQPPRAELGVVVLAAGRASRLGSLKPLVPVRGEALVARLIRQLQALSSEIVVVTGHRADEVEAGLGDCACHVRFVRNPRTTGLAGSCAVGVSGWSPESTPSALLVVLGDNVTESALFERVLGVGGELVLGCSDSPLDDEAMKLRANAAGRPERLGKSLGPPVVGEFVGVFLARGRGLDRLHEVLELHGPEGDLCDGPLNSLLADPDLDVRLADCRGIPWIEIDFPEDVSRMSVMRWSPYA